MKAGAWCGQIKAPPSSLSAVSSLMLSIRESLRKRKVVLLIMKHERYRILQCEKEGKRIDTPTLFGKALGVRLSSLTWWMILARKRLIKPVCLVLCPEHRLFINSALYSALSFLDMSLDTRSQSNAPFCFCSVTLAKIPKLTPQLRHWCFTLWSHFAKWEVIPGIGGDLKGCFPLLTSPSLCFPPTMMSATFFHPVPWSQAVKDWHCEPNTSLWL